MKNKIVLFVMMIGHAAVAQEGALEQYFQVQNKEAVYMMPIVHYQSKKNWYTEVRYNYEDQETLSVYAGKVFSRIKKVTYSVAPILGIVTGKFKGGSMGFNLNIEYKKLFVASQSQYTFSMKDKTANFLYSWSEVGYDIASWIYLGAAVQYTQLYQIRHAQVESGVVVGLSMGSWTFPLYSFSPMSDNRYFLLGINRKLE